MKPFSKTLPRLKGNCWQTSNIQGWAFAHFENERTLLFLSEKGAIWKMLIYCYFLLFLKERKSDCSFHRSFWKSDCSFCCSFWKSEIAMALLVALLKRAIAHLLFGKERRKERSLILSFAKSDEKSTCSFALFKRANERAIAQSLFLKERKWAKSKWAIA